MASLFITGTPSQSERGLSYDTHPRALSVQSLPSVQDASPQFGSASITPQTSIHSLGTVVAETGSTKSGLGSQGLKKQEPSWQGYENEEMPGKTQGKVARNLRHHIFTIYRRLFSIVFIVNMVVFIWILVVGNFDARRLAGIVIANLFCAILMRQDYVINAFFKVFCAAPPSWPLAIRLLCARVYHLGGIHSGSAISGVIWFVLFCAQATRELTRGGKTSAPTVAISYVILVLLMAIVAFAHPTMRARYHDHFEKTHRFLGWAVTALVWVQFVFLSIDYKSPEQALGRALVESPNLWLLIILSCSIILPWTRLRKVPVRSVVLSNHAVRLYFDYVNDPVPGSFTRVSERPLLEWHSFATIAEPGKKGYSLVVSRAGDWTSKQIENPPTHLWVRGIPTCGALRIVPLFRKVVFVATGSGIGPFSPHILQGKVPFKLLWTSPNVRETFGDELVDTILGVAPDALIWDTRKQGKPDMVKLAYRLVKESDAEAVCVISNQKLTDKVVYGMMSRGIPAFGAIWDS